MLSANIGGLLWPSGINDGDGSAPPLDRSEILLQARLKEAGYRTASVGKLHYTPPTPESLLPVAGVELGTTAAGSSSNRAPSSAPSRRAIASALSR